MPDIVQRVFDCVLPRLRRYGLPDAGQAMPFADIDRTVGES